MKIIKTDKYIKIAGSWDIYVNFWKSRDIGQQGHVLFQNLPFPETEEQIEKLWEPKNTNKNKNRNNA